MTRPFVTLERVSYALPDGRRLFSDLNLVLDARRTALVGRNGVGKSVLAELVAGLRAPAQGHRQSDARVFHLPQRVASPAGATVATLARVDDVLAALARIEAGSVDARDFDRVGAQWDLRQRFVALLDRHGLGHVQPDQPAATLSGGEQTRVALLGAWLADADLLVLDEPTNPLDRTQRTALQAQLQAWNGGLLVVSHDRALLQTMERTLELTPHGLDDYPGDYADYVRASEAARQQASALLEQRKLERRRGEAQLRRQRERQERRAAQGARSARDENQAPILLGLRRQRSENSLGKLRQQQAERRSEWQVQVADAARAVIADDEIVLFAPDAATQSRRVAVLDDVVLPHRVAAGAALDLIVRRGQRIGVTGDNGSGKSTLLRVLAGAIAPLRGRCELGAPCAYLDQSLSLLDPDRPVLRQLMARAPSANASELRSRLALLGLDAAAIERLPHELSGGERLKAALAAALYRDEAVDLLLLDEPDTHLDLFSLQALERTLQHYRGALVVVSHDAAFLDALSLDTRIEPGVDGWAVRPWTSAS